MKKRFTKSLSAAFPVALVLSSGLVAFQSSAAQAGNGGSTGVGGGGDASEIRVNEIRTDIDGWIDHEGARGLDFSHSRITYEQYVNGDEHMRGMKKVLAQHAVILSFTDHTILVDGKEKTCHGFVDPQDQRLFMECNIDRFKNTAPDEQYRLIDHEYSILAGVERNEGASSDYTFASQITDFLVPETVLRLAVKRRAPPPKPAAPAILSRIATCTVTSYTPYVEADEKVEMEDGSDVTKSYNGQQWSFSADIDAIRCGSKTVNVAVETSRPGFPGENQIMNTVMDRSRIKLPQADHDLFLEIRPDPESGVLLVQGKKDKSGRISSAWLSGRTPKGELRDYWMMNCSLTPAEALALQSSQACPQ